MLGTVHRDPLTHELALFLVLTGPLQPGYFAVGALTPFAYRAGASVHITVREPTVVVLLAIDRLGTLCAFFVYIGVYTLRRNLGVVNFVYY